MFVKDVIIDGFKSYGRSVDLPHFDPHFNAITGLNGSGKSNILDAICFVLGISNLSKVRVERLTEFIYKKGQAGVTQATVSIIFDNLDKEKSPTGYADKDTITVTRQITVGGRNKYKINGINTTLASVKMFFQSVGLNVNNANFLIMQGRVTKVLSMKPGEILSMLEEATGTRMYDHEKAKALKMFEKKHTKVRHIDEVLENVLEPALRRLHTDHNRFLQFSEAERNLQPLKRFCIAHEFHMCQQKEENGTVMLDEVNGHLHQCGQEAQQLAKRVEEIDVETRRVQAEKERRAGTELKDMQTALHNLDKQLVHEKTKLGSQQEVVKGEEAACIEIQESLTELSEDVFEAKYGAAMSDMEQAQAKHSEAQRAVHSAECELEGAQSGDGRDEFHRTLPERLEHTKSILMAAASDIQQKEGRINFLQNELGDHQRQLAAMQQESANLQTELQNSAASVQEMESRIQALDCDDSMVQGVRQAVENEQRQVRRCKDRLHELSYEAGGLDIRFKDPYAGFDRSNVRGIVARNLRIKDQQCMQALEVAAGSRLTQLIVGNVETAKALLQRKCLARRVTLIPLDKVRYREISAAKREAARKLVGDAAVPAMDLIEFDPALAAAIKYTFGNVFICKDAETAKKLAYDRSVATRCVTLDGRDYSTDGILTDGYRDPRKSVFMRLFELSNMEQELHSHEEALRQAQHQLQLAEQTAQEYRQLKQELDLRKHRHGLTEQRVQRSEGQQVLQQAQSVEQELNAQREALQEAHKQIENLQIQERELQEQLSTFGSDPAKYIRLAKEKVKAAKKEVTKTSRQLKQAEQLLNTAIAEKEQADVERGKVQEQMQEAGQKLHDAQQNLAACQERVRQCQAHFNEQEAKLKEKEASLLSFDQASEKLSQEKEAINDRVSDLNIKKGELEHKQKEVTRQVAGVTKRAQELMQAYRWIDEEKHNFGRPGSEYDWSSGDPNNKLREYNKAKETVEKLGKRVNSNVMSELVNIQKEMHELQQKRRILQRDQQKIKLSMDELDKKREKAIEVTWRRVDQEFGSIFSTLIPDAQAKLVPQDGQTFMQGLQFKVAFSGVWTESLSELSGGQRSLCALSLILALLLFNPAPFYILDEVDAALDLSHTQNMGSMIRRFFPQSQFIIVSLREGMFNNAKVIFRTKLVEGCSSVTREEHRH